MKFARHRCNQCKKIFDCERCKHRAEESAAFCSDECRKKELATLPFIAAFDVLSRRAAGHYETQMEEAVITWNAVVNVCPTCDFEYDGEVCPRCWWASRSQLIEELSAMSQEMKETLEEAK